MKAVSCLHQELENIRSHDASNTNVIRSPDISSLKFVGAIHRLDLLEIGSWLDRSFAV
jgi:hypothetical protein